MSAPGSESGSADNLFPEVETRKSFLAGLVGMKIADRYEVVRVLGEGGMGVVAEARHISLGHRVAIKFMFPDLLSNEVLSARFSREAKLAAKVQSPHIVRMTDVGRLPSGIPYLVMDLLNGHDLGAELDEKGVLPVEKAVDYTLQACAGVAALHAIGAVHRDLKPSNLFVADMAGVSTVMVLDFGIAKDVDVTVTGAITSTETQLGTPMYMSPEQIRSSKNVDARSDIWSMGIILYELLTGTLPFERSGHSLGELFAVILMSDPIPLSMRRPELPAALDEVVMRALRRSSWDRYESVGAFAEALRPFIRPNLAHRVDAVRKALGTAEPSSLMPATRGSEPTVSAASPGWSAPTPSKPTPAVAVSAPTPTSLAEPSLELDLPVRPPPPTRRARDVQSPSLVSSSRSVAVPGERNRERGRPDERDQPRSLVPMIAGACALLGAGIAFAVISGHASTPLPESSPGAAGTAPTSAVSPYVAPTEAPVDTAWAVGSASASVAAHAVTPPPPPHASQPAPKPPPVRPSVARPAVPASAAPRPVTTETLLDTRQ